jgi:prepilin-type N-terminal cleavage/methylation domain-containing protein
MFNKMKNRADWSDKSVSQKGFTLIELLVVIAILGILAVVGVLSFGGLTNSAKQATNKTELTQVQTAADAYQAKNGTVPADTAVLVTDGELRGGANAIKCTYAISATGDVTQTTCPA